MEKNPDSQQPEFCVSNCGFYGNPIYNNMCSKCFKEQQQKQNVALQQDASQSTKATTAIQIQPPAAAAATEAPSTTIITAATGSPAPAALASPQHSDSHVAHNPLVKSLIADDSAAPELLSSSAPCSLQQTPVVPLSPSASGSSTPTKRTQANKGRCFKCRSRVPLVKQTTNKCRCEHVFCDTHRFPDQHSCEFDFMARDRKDLEKRNPKINDHPKGGRSFTRID